MSFAAHGLVLPQAAAVNLDEFLLTLLLEKHGHNYSEELRSGIRAIAPRLIREAEQRTTGTRTESFRRKR